jgi:glycosyltransferase involved in cell wall biosynthesis
MAAPERRRVKLSVVVITKDEEAVIRRCLESVAWADEIVVVDSGSTDRTLDICRELGAKVHVTSDWPGPGPQRNRAIDLAGGEWILALDADEWVTDDLRAEIERIVRASDHRVAFRIPRLSSYCGRDMRHGGWWPDYVARLFRRGRARYAGGIVHDHLAPEGEVGKLRSHLMHEAFTDLEEVLHKVNSYSSWGAQTLEQAGRRAGVTTAVAHGVWTFFKTYLLHGGFLDGREGFLLAVSNAEGTYYKYVKLWLRGRTRDTR